MYKDAAGIRFQPTLEGVDAAAGTPLFSAVLGVLWYLADHSLPSCNYLVHQKILAAHFISQVSESGQGEHVSMFSLESLHYVLKIDKKYTSNNTQKVRCSVTLRTILQRYC